MELYGTLGGSCTARPTLRALFSAGMTGARLNLSHTSLTQCEGLLADFHTAAWEVGVDRPRLVIDLQGAELRLGRLDAPVSLTQGQEVLLGRDGLPVPQAVCAALTPGQRLSLDDSALLLEALSAPGEAVACRVVRGGVLRSRKSIALLDAPQPQLPPLTHKDLENLSQAAGAGVTDILQPFVRRRADVDALRAALRDRGLSQVRIMAKIESLEGVEHLDEIMDAADMICIARGDLGNAIPLWELPPLQRRITLACRRTGTPFLVVTQLLWSMEQRSVPTRAEVNDIYHAVLDGAQALMLTGETAAGRYPVEAMDMLARTAWRALEDREEAATHA